MTLAPYVQILGRGPGRSRSLTQSEAREAMVAMLDPDTSAAAVGALLMLLRMKGETAEEIAGISAAAQEALTAMPHADLDWPSYAAGRTRGAPWFLISAKLVAAAGHRVLLHGWNGADQTVRTGIAQAGIGIATSSNDAARLLDRHGIAYLPLETLHPALFHLLGLREVLGLRSCINTVCRMLNPSRAAASVQGVFHPSYRLLQAEAAALLGWENLTVIKGGGGEFERHPAKDIAAFGLRAGTPWEGQFGASMSETRRLAEDDPATVWTPDAPSAFATRIVLDTAASALSTLGHAAPDAAAHNLWLAQRHTHAA